MSRMFAIARAVQKKEFSVDAKKYKEKKNETHVIQKEKKGRNDRKCILIRKTNNRHTSLSTRA